MALMHAHFYWLQHLGDNMNLIKKTVLIFLLFSLFMTSSCAINKKFKRNTMIVLGAAAGIVLTANIARNHSDSSDNDNDYESVNGGGGGGGGGILLIFGGLFGGWFGYGFDLATSTKEKEEPNNNSNDKPQTGK
jgi:hypothetical protein